jgi:hypothetical protein
VARSASEAQHTDLAERYLVPGTLGLLTTVSVPDPNQGPDPHVFGPPGSGFIYFYHHGK